ncbi:MAG TPA: hypothetical protein VFQ53_39600 [Kofleriaceae bacterium]|nr:hypothetical protein [Kofleriaceae bacterium]
MRWLACLGVLAASPAHADRWRSAADRVQGGAFLHYELTGLTARLDDARSPDPVKYDDLVLAGVRLHGFLGKGPTLAYHVGIDLFAGSTIGAAGFAYDVSLYPVGFVVRLGATSIVGLAAGVQASGAVGTLDDAVAAPVELTAELGRGIRVLARARVSYVAGADARQSGAPSLPTGDELDAMLGLRLGTRYEDQGFPTGNGYFIAASYREQGGVRFAGLTIGYSIDLAMPRRFSGRARTSTEQYDPSDER